MHLWQPYHSPTQLLNWRLPQRTSLIKIFDTIYRDNIQTEQSDRYALKIDQYNHGEGRRWSRSLVTDRGCQSRPSRCDMIIIDILSFLL